MIVFDKEGKFLDAWGGDIFTNAHGIYFDGEPLMTKSEARPYSDVFPIVPTPFTESDELNLDGQRRVLDCMIDQGVT